MNAKNAKNGTKATRQRDAHLTAIARRVLFVETLETRNSDRLDFHEVSAGALLTALREAWMAGYEQAVTDRP